MPNRGEVTLMLNVLPLLKVDQIRIQSKVPSSRCLPSKFYILLLLLLRLFSLSFFAFVSLEQKSESSALLKQIVITDLYKLNARGNVSRVFNELMGVL